MRRFFSFAIWALMLAISVPEAAAQTSDEVLYYHTDAVGSVRMITDANQQVVARYDYLPFGEPYPPAPCGDSRQFAGKECDAETGFDYFGARYLKAAQGRFTSVDPLARSASPRLPQTWNRYSYALNNPLRYIDVKGTCSSPAGIGAGQVGVCIATYIKTRWFKGIGRGDGRGPVGNDPNATFRTQTRLIVDTKSGRIVSWEDDAGVSGVVLKGAGPEGRNITSLSVPTVDENGAIQLNVSTTGINGFNARGLQVTGDIDFSIDLGITRDGQVFLAGGMRDAFPALEIYQYDSSGNVIQILTMPQTTPEALAPPMEQPIPAKAPARRPIQ